MNSNNIFFFKNAEGVIAYLDKNSNRKVKKYFNKYSEFEGIPNIRLYLLENTAVCAIQTTVNTTKLISETPEKLTCLMEKFPVLKRGVEQAVACLNDDLCQQKESYQIKTQGSESLEFQIGRVSEV